MAAMKILCIVPEYPPHSGGGMSLYYKILLGEWARLGHDIRVVVAAPFSAPFAAYEHDGVRVECVADNEVRQYAERFSHLGPTPRLRRYLSAAWAAWEYARHRYRVDVVEVADWGLLFVPWVVEPSDAVVSVTLHGSVGQIDLYDPVPGAELEGVVVRLVEASVLAGTDGLVTYSSSNAAAWTRTLGRGVTVIPPPFRITEPSRGFGLSSAQGLVVARVQYWKGPHVLCEALQRTRATIPPIRWVGRDMPYGTHPSMSKMLTAQYPGIWGRRIVPVGAQSPEETAALELGAAFVVVPSLWDVFNLVTAEALSFEKVVIVSSGAGASELITDGVDGFVCPGGDAAALASVLEDVVAMPEEACREIGRRGRQLVERELNAEDVASLRLRAYAQAIEGRSERRKVSEWVSEAVRPRAGGGLASAFLNQMALRELATHVGGRVLERIRGGLTGGRAR
jgi:glycosyltransferase involved in cell wall biosynthesis